MKRRVSLTLLALLPALNACEDSGARAQNAALARRVGALERELGALRAAQDPPEQAAQARTTQAAAQNCANDLTRTLELFRVDSVERRYPTAAELALPASCEAARVRWVRREARAYAFAVLGAAGQTLARQSSAD